MPPFRQSAMDGYALNLHEKDRYEIIGEVKAGSDYEPELKPGQAVRIFTGAMVPDTANVVVKQEKNLAFGRCSYGFGNPKVWRKHPSLGANKSVQATLL